MAKLTRNEIRDMARKLLADAPAGLRWSELLRAIAAASPETPPNSIQGTMYSFVNSAPEITKIGKGLYSLGPSPADDQPPSEDEAQEITVPTSAGPVKVREESFYQPFADWLKDEKDEVNEVIVLGGNMLKSKWGTPDILGVFKARKADPIPFAPQVVSAEIKIDPVQPIVAFGQAVAYRLFSHKSYIVVPETTSREDLDRLDALSTIYGLGLVTFRLDPEAPGFMLRVSAQLAQPDMFYVNQMAKRVRDIAPEEFERLF